MPRLADIIGHSAPTGTLRTAIERGRVPHALLLEGPPNIGKARVARSLSAALLCAQPHGGDACGVCPACTKTEMDAHPDAHYVRANDKGNVLLDAVRSMEASIRLHAHEGGRKVVIIEDAERARIPAQNALLKTLEEPPPNTHLLLTSSRPEALLPTILSRCQRLRFGPLTEVEVTEVLRRQAPELGPDARARLARRADGAPGRALGLDDAALQALHAQVAELDALVDAARGPGALADALAQATALAKAPRPSVGEFLEAWATWARDQVLIEVGHGSAGPEPAGIPVVHLGEEATLTKLAKGRSLEARLARAEALFEARRQLDLPYHLNPQLVLEQLVLTLFGHLPPRRLPAPFDAASAL